MDKELAKPGFLAMICSVELLERFAYYGLTSLLIIFLTSNLGFSDTKAYATSSLFVAIGFAVPIVGGILADKALGLRYLINIGAILTLLGYGFISTFCTSEKFFTFGLALIAVGTGIFKGNLTILLGACYFPKEASKQNRGFTLFYVCINIGALMSAIMCGYITKNWGVRYGFVTASLGMLFSFFIFSKYESLLQNVGKISVNSSKSIPIIKAQAAIFLTLAILIILTTYALHYSIEASRMLGWSAMILCLYYAFIASKANSEERPKLLVLLLIIPFLTVFYSLQSQLYFSINLFTVRNLETVIFGHVIPSTAFQSIAPSATILTGLFLSRILRKNVEKENHTSGFIRFGIGLMGPFFCFLILYFGCCGAINGKVSCLYLLSLCFIGGAESLVGPFAYHQATILAPARMKGYAMSIVLVSIAFGNLSTALISKFMSIKTLEYLDCEQSLVIYKKGFFSLVILQATVCVCFFVTYFLLKKRIDSVYKSNKCNNE